MNPPLHAPVLAEVVRTPAPARPAAPAAVHTVLQRAFAPRQLTLPLRPRG